MAAEYNQDQPMRSELDEPRRTTDQGNDFGTGSVDDSQQQREGGGFGGVREDEPPHHKLHSDDEPLPKPAPGTYDEDLPSSGRREDQGIPQRTSEEGYGDAPTSTEGYGQQDHYSEPAKFDEDPVQTGPTDIGTGGGFGSTGQRSGGVGSTGQHSDPSEAFPGAPVDRTVEEPGYGYDQKTETGVPPTSQTGISPTSDTGFSPTTQTGVAPTSDTGISPTSGTGTPKKEGLMTKIKEKLPGHHKSAADTTMEHDSTTEYDSKLDQDTASGGTPKKGLMTKIKEKLPGHHNTGTTTTE